MDPTALVTKRQPSSKPGKLAVFALIVGGLSGIGAITFYVLLELVTTLFLEGLAGFYPPYPGGEPPIFHLGVIFGRVPLFLLPAIGGLLCGQIVYRLAPDAEGHGTDAAIKAFHRQQGFIDKRIPIVKTVASAFVIGTGGSAGSEGPITQIGAGVGSILATRLHLSNRDRRILLVSGMAGGLGGIFRSPFGGAIFAIEVLYRKDHEVEALIPSFISSIVSYTIFELFISSLTGTPFGTHHIFTIPSLQILSAWEMTTYMLLGLLCAGFGIVYTKVFHFVHDLFKKARKVPKAARPVIGGILVGLLALFVPQVLGIGYGTVQNVINGILPFHFVLVIVLVKVLATSLTIGSGGSGGVFAPTMVIGALLGSIIGSIFIFIAPDVIGIPANYVLVGMAAFLAAVAKTPIAVILMVLEISGGFTLLPVAALASFVAYAASGNFSLYSEQLSSRNESPAHLLEMTREILKIVKVKDVMTSAKNVFTFTDESKVTEVLQAVQTTGFIGYPVLKEGKVTGIISLNEIGNVSNKDGLEKTVGEVMKRDITGVFENDDVASVLERLDLYKLGRLPVISREGSLVGIVTRSDIIKKYATMIKESD